MSPLSHFITISVKLSLMLSPYHVAFIWPKEVIPLHLTLKILCGFFSFHLGVLPYGKFERALWTLVELHGSSLVGHLIPLLPKMGCESGGNKWNVDENKKECTPNLKENVTISEGVELFSQMKIKNEMVVQNWLKMILFCFEKKLPFFISKLHLY